MFMKKHIIFGVITLILLLVVIYFIFIATGKQNVDIKIPPTEVAIAKVEKHNIPITAEATGQLIAPQSVSLKSQISGIVNSINFTSGEYVKKGQTLMRLDDTEQKANVNSTLADYTQAKAQYDRTETLYNDNKVVSQSELDTAKSTYLQAKAKYESALYQLSNTTISAPFSGYLSLTTLADGSYVSAGDNLVDLVDKENLQLEYALDESYASSIHLGQMVDFRTDAFEGKVFHAKVSYISPSVSSDNLTFTVRAAFDNKNNLLSPGMSVYISQVLKKDNDVLAVPESALSAQSGGFIVYLYEKGKAKAQSVKIGQIYRGYVSIISGLKLGDSVIATTEGSISDGQSVKVEK